MFPPTFIRPLLAQLIGAVFLAVVSCALGQGLVSVQNYSSDFKESEPLTWSVTTRGGFDSLKYRKDTLGLDSFDSYYIQGSIGATYSVADNITPWSIAVDLGLLRYLDEVPRYDDTYYNSRVAFNIAHQFSERLKISNNFYLSYEAQPNVMTGATTTLYNGQYLYGLNNLNVSYAWSRRFSTTTSYTVDGITYEDDLVGALEDRMTHLFAQQFAYAITQHTNLTAEYRYGITNYRRNTDANSRSHYILAGIDQAWSQRFTGSFRAGAQMITSKRAQSTAPYGEFGLNYAIEKQTMIRWFTSLGYDASEVGGFDTRYSLHSGLTMTHQVNKRLGVSGSLGYSYSEFDAGRAGSINEQSVSISAGLNYSILDNLKLDARYTYSVLQSDDSTRDYDRHNISVGVTATF